MLNRRSMPLSSLRAFESAGQHLHMGRAGEALGVTHGAISHQIRLLEQQLEVKLFYRGNRGLQLTPAGERLLLSVQKGLDQIISCAAGLNDENLAGVLKVGCTSTIGLSWAVRHIMEFQANYPEMTIHIIELEALQRDIPRDIDIAICYGEPLASNRRLEQLTTPSIFPVCNPSLLYGQVPIIKAEQLLEFALLHDAQLKWEDWFLAMGVTDIDDANSTFFGSTSLSLKAARDGYGIALANAFEIEQDFKSGRLVKVINRSIAEPHSYYLLCNQKQEQSQRAQLFEASVRKVILDATS